MSRYCNGCGHSLRGEGGAGFSPDGKLIAAVDAEGRLHIWTYVGNGNSDVFATVKVYPDELLGRPRSLPIYGA